VAHGFLVIACLNSLELFFLLLLFFIIHDLLDGELTLPELGKNLILGRHFALHPGVLQNLLNCWSLVCVKLQHSLHKILELLRKVLKLAGFVLAMGTPENIEAVGRDTSIERVNWLRSGEWGMLGHHHEEDDGGGEQVHAFSLIWLLQVDFWCHVVHGAQLGVELARTISAVNRSRKSEIRDLKVEVLVKQEVLRLEVPMGHSLVMAVVETVHELAEEISGDLLLKPSSVGDVIEYLASLGQFEDNIADVLDLAGVLDEDVLPVLELLDDVLMGEDGHSSHLGKDQLLHLVGEAILHYLDSDRSIRAELVTQFHFARRALA
jgi:hypothetical protein